MQEFSGRVALVTGTTGIGRAVAKRFAEGGASVLVCGIESAGNTDLVEEATKLGLALRVEKCDVARPDEVCSAVGNAVSAFGGLDIIVNAVWWRMPLRKEQFTV